MPNRSAKGARLQRLAREALEQVGYEVETARPRIVWLGPKRPISVVTDFWSRIDLIAVHQASAVKLVQVSVPSELSRKRKLLQGWQPFGCEVEVWIYHGGRGRRFRCYSAASDFRAYTEWRL